MKIKQDFDSKSSITGSKGRGMNLKQYSFGFTLIEILTTIAIIAVVGIIAVTYSNNYKLTQYNTKRVADIDTLKNTLASYYEVNKIYPEPNGNKQYYDINGTYEHSSSGSYGVSGFVTSNTFGKSFMNYLPIDPQTNNFYAYAKTNGNNLGYQFATALDVKGVYSAYVQGNYDGEDMAGIIKEYNGPNFVINGSEVFLPYNPYEIKLTGKIKFYSGTVLVSPAKAITEEITEGDTIDVSTGGIANIYLSDGSELILGNSSKNTQLIFNTLEYKDNSNIVTKVILKLNLGELWVKAPKLEANSSLRIETDLAAATVRGTIFGMEYSSGALAQSGTINLISGKIEVEKTPIHGSTAMPFYEFGYPTNQYGTGYSIDYITYKSYMEVKEGEKPILLKYSGTTEGYGGLPTGSGNVSTGVINEILTPEMSLNSSIIPNILSLKDLGTTPPQINLSIENKGANYVKINGTLYPVSTQSGIVDLTYYQSPPNISPTNTIPLEIQLVYSGAGNYSESAIKTIEVNPGIDLDSKKTGLIDELPKEGQECAEGQSTFANFGCQDDNLVAYAPYDTQGDVFMYTKNGDVLPMMTKYVIGDCMTGSVDTLMNKESAEKSLINSIGYEYGDSQECIPALSGSMMIFKNNTCNTNNDSSRESLKTVNIGVIDFIQGFSFFQFPNNSGGGIFLDNTASNNDYLKYQVYPLGLKDKYVIEMGVRGVALKRIPEANKPYFLWDGGDNNKVALKLVGSAILYNIKAGAINIKINEIINQLKDNEIYTIKLIANGNNNNIQLISPNGNVLGDTTNFEYNSPLNGDLYIGSPNNNKFQWNDIIDFVKIYKID